MVAHRVGGHSSLIHLCPASCRRAFILNSSLSGIVSAAARRGTARRGGSGGGGGGGRRGTRSREPRVPGGARHCCHLRPCRLQSCRLRPCWLLACRYVYVDACIYIYIYINIVYVGFTRGGGFCIYGNVYFVSAKKIWSTAPSGSRYNRQFNRQ